MARKGPRPPKNRLADLLFAIGYSQADLARDVGVDRSYISHIACGRRIPSMKRAARIARALDITLEELTDTLRI